MLLQQRERHLRPLHLGTGQELRRALRQLRLERRFGCHSRPEPRQEISCRRRHRHGDGADGQQRRCRVGRPGTDVARGVPARGEQLYRRRLHAPQLGSVHQLQGCLARHVPPGHQRRHLHPHPRRSAGQDEDCRHQRPHQRQRRGDVCRMGQPLRRTLQADRPLQPRQRPVDGELLLPEEDGPLWCHSARHRSLRRCCQGYSCAGEEVGLRFALEHADEEGQRVQRRISRGVEGRPLREPSAQPVGHVHAVHLSE